MVWSARISPLKKLALIGMFCGGLITAVAGILRCTFILLDRPDGPQLAGEWSCRESFIAVFISNIPVLYPILHKFFKHVKETAYSHSRSRSRSARDGKSPGVTNTTGGSRSYKLSTLSKPSKKKEKFKHPLSLPGETFYERFGSEEEIIGADGKTPGRSSAEKSDVEVRNKVMGSGDDIVVTREWQVQNHGAAEEPHYNETAGRVGFHAR
jgi:hypothetical protein